MVSGFDAPTGQGLSILITPQAAGQAAGGLRQALQQAGWQVIVSSDVATYASSVRACVIVISPQTASEPEVTAAINANFPVLVPVVTQPMPVPYAQWIIAPVLLGETEAQQQTAGAAIAQALSRVATSPAPSLPAQPAPPSTPYYPPQPYGQPAPPSTPYYPSQYGQPAPPSTPYYPSQPYGQPAPPSTPYYPQPYGQPAPPSMPYYPPQPNGQQPWGQPGAYPSVTANKPSGIPIWARTLIIVGVIAAIALGGFNYAQGQHVFNPNALSGHWTMNLTIESTVGQGSTTKADLELVENGAPLTGTLTLQNLSIPMSGSLNGQSLSLKGTASDPAGSESVDIVFTGTASSDSQHMSGNAQYTLHAPPAPDQTLTGPWTGDRSQGGSGGQTSSAPAGTALLRRGWIAAR